MWYDTSAAARLGVVYPIIQGPFGGGLSSTVLAATVSNAGGVGSYGCESLRPEQITDVVTELRSLTPKPFALNLWIPKGGASPPGAWDFQTNLSLLDGYYQELGIAWPCRPDKFGPNYEEQLRALLDARPPIFSFVYGVPEKSLLDECRSRDIITVETATTSDETVALDDAGVDCIVASGFEAGGHKAAFLRPVEDSLMGTFSLVPLVVDRVKAPVIAAGRVADGRGVKAALALGA